MYNTRWRKLKWQSIEVAINWLAKGKTFVS